MAFSSALPAFIKNIPASLLEYHVGNEYEDRSELPRGRPLSERNGSVEYSSLKQYLSPPTASVEETSTAGGQAMEDTSAHDTKDLSEGKKRIKRNEIHLQQNPPPRRRRRRSNGTGTAPALDRRHNRSSRNGAKHRKTPRHRHRIRSSMARNRNRKRVSGGGIALSPNARKERKTISGIKTRHMMQRMTEDGGSYRPKRSNAESGDNEMSCMHLIMIFKNTVVDFFCGFATG
jgi:hypothetical protein